MQCLQAFQDAYSRGRRPVCLGVLCGIGDGLQSARLQGLQDLQLFVVVAGFLGHYLLLNCRVALQLGMMVFRKISDSVSINGMR
jgi:hypothetical protein